MWFESKTAGSIVVLAALVLGGCGAGSDSASTDDQATGPTVSIDEPAEGATVQGPDVVVRLSAENLEIVAAGVNQPGSGHHHLIHRRADKVAVGPPLDVPIPAIDGRYIHMGKGQTEFVLEGLTPGSYEVIALVGDYLHIPLDPPVADTVNFTVAID